MGYTGRIVVARSGQRLTETLDAAVLDEKDLGGGWQSLQLDGDLRSATQVLVDQTGAPALSAFVVDSDLADVSGQTPSGVRWRTYLHENAALQLGAPPLTTSPDEVVRQALAWSAEAGLTASEGALRAALQAHNTFAEETLDELLAALGLLAPVSP
jgi:hypothetical protein